MLIGFRVILTTAFENFTQVMFVPANQFGSVTLLLEWWNLNYAVRMVAGKLS